MSKKGVFVRLPIYLIEQLEREKSAREKSFQETVRDLLEERLAIGEPKDEVSA